MRVLGISAFYHDSAAALIEEGRVVAAAQEERFTRKRHDADFPANAVGYCLEAPSAETSAAFLDLALARCRRRRRGLTAGWALLAAEVALFIPWIHHRLHLGASPTAAEVLTAYGFLATMAGTTAVILVWLGRRTRLDMRELEGLARGLGAAD